MTSDRWKYLSKIDSPNDLRKLNITELKDVSQEIREYMVETIAKIGGHLGANLGAVELTVALHYVFNTPKDLIVWDVGHQAYPHKILTGRRDALPTIRQFKGLSGFNKISESPYDTFGVGHASTSISAALGMATARDFDKENYKVIAVIGDGAMTGGLAYEAMNNCGLLKKDMIVVLNDNNMSISQNVWAISNYFNEVISGDSYNNLKKSIFDITQKYFPKGDRLAHMANKVQSSLKSIVTPGMLFEALGFRYFGPMNGHNLVQLVKMFKNIKSIKGPIVVHLITEKGKGYAPAENDSSRLHGVTPFDVNTGHSSKHSTIPSYTEIFGDAIVELAEKNEKLVGITAAMGEGTCLNRLQEKFPERFFDVGIAEGHAVTFSAGLAVKGYRPVVAIYSTFLQRAYDHLIHDVALQNLPVIFAIDRSGLVGADGPTHHGTFDLTYLRPIPGIVIAAPKDEDELRNLLYTATLYEKGPFAIRYPRGKGSGKPISPGFQEIEIGKGEILRSGKDLAVLAVGSMVNQAMKLSILAEEKGISIEVVNMRFIKPIDENLLIDITNRFDKILCLEENSIIGGFGSAVLESMDRLNIKKPDVYLRGLPDEFIEHGSIDELYKLINLDVDSLLEYVLKDILNK
jgi:1-deoxy-D-xylulose-5-phosphate synthase